jgi:hypothetical protein
MESSGDNYDFTDDTFEDSEEEVLKYYFFRGFTYEEILLFLAKRHHCTISYSTLLRRLKKYGLMRRGVTNKDSFENTFLQVQRRIAELINGPGSSMGYRAIWHALELEGIRVPRVIVQDLLKEMDPEGAELRKRHRLKRRAYHNPGPNYSWHIDGYDKLKCWGFPIHGAIDGYSRRILWLRVTRSNNSPNQIASFYAGVVLEQGGCPVQLVTDLGTENGTAAALQSYFRDNSEAHRYVPSPRNQRIEGWWAYYARSHSQWWRNFFKDLESQGIVDTACEINMECLWYCFHKLLQTELDLVKEHWNSHRIRKSRHDTIPGRPDSLYFLPQLHGSRDYLFQLAAAEIGFASENIIEDELANDHQEYFEYVRNNLSLSHPEDWEEAFNMFRRINEYSS